MTGTDLVALPLLSVRVARAELVLDVLEKQAADIATLLAAIPVGLAMHEAPWSIYARGSAAYQLYYLLRRCRDAGPTTAHKLLARKRPHLLPVYDAVVRRLLGGPADSWACLWTWFQGNADRAGALAGLRDEVRQIDDISLLRVLDVALWIHGTR